MEAALPGFRASQASQAEPPASAGTSAPSASGGMSDYQKRLVTQHLDSPRMQHNTAVFNGTDFVSEVPFETIDRYYRAFNSELEKAKRAWNRQISSRARSTPDGHALRKRLVEAQNWANAMAAKYPIVKAQFDKQQQAAAATRATAKEAEAATAQHHKTQCASFQSGAMTPLNREPMIRLINQSLHGNSRIGAVDGVNAHARIAAEVDEVCQSVDLAAFRTKPCWYVLNRPEHDPVRWCEAAQNADTHIQAAALNHAKTMVSTTGTSTIQSPEQLMAREGFLTFESPVTFAEKLHFSGGVMNHAMAPVTKLLAAVGIENADDAIWGEQKQRLAALRAAVESSATTWQLPEKKGENYSGELAVQQVRRMHPDAHVYAAYLSRASWKIHRNSLGVILRRTLPGYVMFKLPADPFCQLRPYTLTESYAGGGAYQEASGVRLGYIRFQSCPE